MGGVVVSAGGGVVVSAGGGVVVSAGGGVVVSVGGVVGAGDVVVGAVVAGELVAGGAVLPGAVGDFDVVVVEGSGAMVCSGLLVAPPVLVGQGDAELGIREGLAPPEGFPTYGRAL
jgi:hypothetical protein